MLACITQLLFTKRGSSAPRVILRISILQQNNMVRPTFLLMLALAVVGSSMAFKQPLSFKPPCNSRDPIVDLQNGFKSLNIRMKAQELENERLQYEMKIKDSQIQALNGLMSRRNLQLGAGPSYAFSAYLGETKHLGTGEKIEFNREIFDDGDRYNPDTGIYNVPMSGVYMFTFFISTSQPESTMNAKLTVNNMAESNAIVMTEHPGMQSQGGNVVIMRLHAGDHVIVKAVQAGKIVSGESDRVSTFSGVMLYP